MTEKNGNESCHEISLSRSFGSKSNIAYRNGSVYEAKPIVCRFKNFKNREVVRKAAQELKGTRYEVS